jgi:hypothetical protein
MMSTQPTKIVVARVPKKGKTTASAPPSIISPPARR